MSKKKVVLLESEEAYGAQLMEYAQKHRKYGLELLLFTKAESLREYLKGVPFVHLLVIAEDKNKSGLPQDKIKKILYLSEEKENPDGLYRYQSMKRILERICAELKEENKEAVFSGKTEVQEILCVFSPIGGSGKTSFSRRLAMEKGKMRRTFLFPMELFPEGAEGNEKPGFSELIYYLKQEEAEIPDKFSAMVCREEGYESLNPGSCPMDYLYMEIKDMERILKLLLEEEGYETLIFDLGFINEACLKLMESADRIYMPDVKSRTGERKMEFWKESLIFMGKDEILNKQEIVNPDGFIREKGGSI